MLTTQYNFIRGQNIEGSIVVIPRHPDHPAHMVFTNEKQ